MEYMGFFFLVVFVYVIYLAFKIKTYFRIYDNSRKLDEILQKLHSDKPTEKRSKVYEPQSVVKKPEPVSEGHAPAVPIKPKIKQLPGEKSEKEKIENLPPLDSAVFTSAPPQENPIDAMQSEVEKKVSGILSRIWNWLIVGEEYRNPKLSLEYAIASTWLLRVAILFIVIGIGYLLKYSIENAIIGPAERVGLSVVAGLIMLLGGIKLHKGKYKIIGQGLLGGSIAVFYFSAFASSIIYHLISTEYAFGVMILVTIFSGVLAVTLDSLLVAILGAIGGYLTPLMLNTGFDNKLQLYSYLAVLGIGVLGMARYKRWKILNVISFFFTYLIFLISSAKVYDKNIHFKITITFATIYFLMFSAITVIYNLVNKEKSTILELFGMFVNVAIYFIIAYLTITDLYPRKYVAIVSTGLALLYSFGVVLLYLREIKDKPLMVFLSGFASFFVTITLPLLITDQWLTCAWAVQALIFLWMSARLKNEFLRGVACSIYFITFLKVVGFDFDKNFINVHTVNYTSELFSRLITFGSLIISTALGYWVLQKERDFKYSAQASFFIWITSIFSFIYLHFEFYYFSEAYYKPALEPLQTLIWVGAILLVLRKIATQRGIFKFTLSVLSVGILIKLFFFDSFFPHNFIYSGLYNSEKFMMRFLDYALVNLAILCSYFVMAKNKDSAKAVFAVSSLGLLFLYATFELNTYLHNYLPAFRPGGISVLWALFATAFVFSGIKADLRSMRFVGLILFTICAAKVFFSDLSRLSSLYKIYASIALGIVILAGAFIYVKFVEKFSTEEKEDTDCTDFH